MSFFGFDPAMPRDRGHPTNAPGFGQAPDPFSHVSNRALEDDEEDAYVAYLRRSWLASSCSSPQYRL